MPRAILGKFPKRSFRSRASSGFTRQRPEVRPRKPHGGPSRCPTYCRVRHAMFAPNLPALASATQALSYLTYVLLLHIPFLPPSPPSRYRYPLPLPRTSYAATLALCLTSSLYRAMPPAKTDVFVCASCTKSLPRDEFPATQLRTTPSIRACQESPVFLGPPERLSRA